MRYAIESNNQVINVILADSDDVAAMIAATQQATARRLADNEQVVLAANPMPATPQMSKLQFLRLFTPVERIAIRSSRDPIVADFLQLLDIASEVQLTDDDTVAGVRYLEQQGLLTAGRSAEILGLTEAQLDELFIAAASL